jgi:hypothetical protein
MNIDLNVANRALSRTGQQAIPATDTSSKSYLMIKKHYLSTVLEALAEYAWTSAKKRATLTAATGENLTEWQFSFVAPIDCAQPLQLQDNEYFVLEGSILYTDAPSAHLLYITNGRVPVASNITTDIYPEYSLPELEPKFWEYIETRLAAKLALELSGKNELYQLLYNDAALIGQSASRASATSSAAKKNGSAWWLDQVRG